MSKLGLYFSLVWNPNLVHLFTTCTSFSFSSTQPYTAFSFILKECYLQYTRAHNYLSQVDNAEPEHHANAKATQNFSYKWNKESKGHISSVGGRCYLFPKGTYRIRSGKIWIHHELTASHELLGLVARVVTELIGIFFSRLSNEVEFSITCMGWGQEEQYYSVSVVWHHLPRSDHSSTPVTAVV